MVTWNRHFHFCGYLTSIIPVEENWRWVEHSVKPTLALSLNSLWCFEVFCMHWILVMIFIDIIKIGSHSWKTSYIIYTVWFCFYNWIYTNNCLQSVIKFYWQLNRFLFSIAASVLNFASCLRKTCQTCSTRKYHVWQLRHWNLHILDCFYGCANFLVVWITDWS